MSCSPSRTKRRPRPVTAREIADAVQALELNIPVRAAERKGTQIILHTRAGDYAYTPKSASGAADKPAPKGKSK